MSYPTVALLTSGHTLSRISGSLTGDNTVIYNFRNTRCIRGSGTLIVRTTSLFNSHSYGLRNVGAFGNTGVSSTVLRATTIIVRVGDPLTGIFSSIVINGRSVLPRISNIVCRSGVNAST